MSTISAQQRNLDACDVEFVDRKPNRGQISLGMGQQERAHRGGALPACLRTFPSHDGVHERTFSRARSAKGGNDQGRLEANAERIDA